MRVDPLPVRPLLFSFPIHTRQIFPRGRLHSRLPCQAFQKLFVALSVVRRTIERSAALASRVVASIPICLPLISPASASNPSTHANTSRCVSSSISRRVRAMVVWSGAPSFSGIPTNSRMDSESPLATRCPVHYQCLRSNPPQQPKIDSRCQAWPPHHRRIKTAASAFHESVKIVFGQQLLQALVKGMAVGSRQGAGWNPELFLTLPPRAHRHTTILRSNILDVNCFLTFTPAC